MKKPVVLIVMDGFAFGKEYEGNAISKARTPNLDLLFKEYPNNTLGASGEEVGLPQGQMGNSEVGHINLGAGRVVYQSLTRINRAIKDRSFFDRKAFDDAIMNVKEHNSKLHIFGLLSDGGVHSHINHIKALIKLAKNNDIEEVYFHAFLDGRDVPPKSAISYVEDLEDYMKEVNLGCIASVSGRYYVMDRDKNWGRTQIAYDIITSAKGVKKDSAVIGIEDSYNEDIVDEFVIPFNVVPEGIVSSNDSVIFANFRPDRAIQISTAISNKEESGLNYLDDLNDVFFVSMMTYAKSVKGPIAFGLQDLSNLYGDVISENGLKQLRIAETEKYAHVTFFFDGGVDKEIEGSERVLINSPKVATYDLKPEMSAYEVTDAVIEQIKRDEFDTIILNFANCDMVGHTGVIEATIKAVEVVDECVGRVVDEVLDRLGVALICADHGNAEKLLDDELKPFTAHTTNPVPIIITKKGIEIRDGGNLGDVTPTMLELLNVEQPIEMTGKSLIKK